MKIINNKFNSYLNGAFGRFKARGRGFKYLMRNLLATRGMSPLKEKEEQGYCLGGLKAEQIAEFNELYALDEPIIIQYISWLQRIIRLDLGTSIYYNEPIISILQRRIFPTFQLASFAMVISLVVAIPAGLVSSIKKDTTIDNLSRIIAFAGISVPNFWLGILLLFVFSVLFPIFPLYGYVSIFNDFFQGLRYTALPAITLGTALAAMVTRMTRSCMLEVLNEDFIVTARAKGLKESKVIINHAFKNAIIPVITIIGLQLGFILGGSVLTEVVFAIPGLGRLMVDSIFQRDFPLVQAIVLLYAFVFIFVNLMVDILYSVFDPQIRYD